MNLMTLGGSSLTLETASMISFVLKIPVYLFVFKALLLPLLLANCMLPIPMQAKPSK